MKKYLVLAGNIGAGKSTLVEALSGRLGFKPFFEPVAENPYLEDFYSDMGRWAFHSQMFFLTHRLLTHRDLMLYRASVIQDRSLYEDAEVFARNLFEQGALSGREWDTYQKLYHTMIDLLPAPDLVVYLRASVDTLQRRIRKRGREFEQSITDTYLGNLNRFYEEWIEGFRKSPVLIVPSDRLDFVEDPKDLDSIVKKIEERLCDTQRLLFPSGM